MLGDDDFPEQIKDPRENLPDLSIRKPGVSLRDRQPSIEDKSESLPSVDEAFEEQPRRSWDFISAVMYVKMGTMMIVGAAVMYFMLGYDIQHALPFFATGIYFYYRAWQKTKKHGS